MSSQQFSSVWDLSLFEIKLKISAEVPGNMESCTKEEFAVT